MQNPKIIILHDYFLYKGGGERLIITMAKRLGADIATAFIAEDAFDPREYGINTRQLYKERRWSKIPGFRYTQVNLAFLFKTRFLKNYDIVIYSGDCFNAIFNARGKKNIAYMHTPPRHLYDSYKDRLKSYGILKKLIFIPYAWFNRIRFEFLTKKLDLIITNSQTVQDRIKKYLKLDSVIAYPPCDTTKFKFIEQGDYFFSWARLYPAKRVDMIVKAFAQMPDKKLIVGSGGPELENLKKLAVGHENIKILGWISDEQLFDLLGKSLATIYIPVREDFGMSPVESMSAGKPVIGVDEGGLRESIIHDKTGILLKPDFTIDDIINAVQSMTAEQVASMKSICENRALDFTEDKFIDKIKEYLNF